MTLLDRYLTRKCILGILLVMAVLIGLTLSFALIDELNKDHDNYGFSEAMRFLLLTMPRRVEELMPYGVFIGLLLVLGNMAEGGELTAFRAAGVSPWRLLAALLPTLLLVLLVNFTLSEFVSPAGERAGKQGKQRALMGITEQPLVESKAITPEDGVWLRRKLDSGYEYAHVGGVDSQGQLTGLLLYRIDDSNRLVEAIFAASGVYLIAEEHWQLSDVNVTSMTTSSSGSRHYQTRPWRNPVSPEQLARQAFSDPRKMTLRQVHQYLSVGGRSKAASLPFELKFWQKTLTPLTYISMALMALAVVIGPLRQTSMGQRLTMGLFIGLGFKYLQELFAPMAAVFSVPTVLAVMIPILIYLAVAQRMIARHA